MNRFIAISILAFSLAGLGCQSGSPVVKAPTSSPADVPQNVKTPLKDAAAAKPKPTDPKTPSVATPRGTATNPFKKRIGEPWIGSSASAIEIAKRVDAKMASLTNMRADSSYVLGVTKGQANGTVRAEIVNRSKFNIQYPTVVNGIPKIAAFRADGSRVHERTLTQAKGSNEGKVVWQLLRSAAKPAPKPGTALVQRLSTELSRTIFGGHIDGGTPFTTVVAALSKGMGGYKVRVEERSTKVGQRVIRNYSIIAERTPEAAAKLGGSRIDMVFDRDLYLPVTVRVTQKVAGQAHTNGTMWTTHWHSGQTFPAESFKVP